MGLRSIATSGRARCFLCNMNRPKLILAPLIGCVLVLSLYAGRGQEPGNPFRVIVESNIFRLKPIPAEEPKPHPKPEPLAPLAQVMLTGIHTIFGPPQALFEITETALGKPVTNRPILREGERQGAIQVLAINVEKSVVRIRNGTVETNLTFDVVKQAAVATQPPAALIPLPTSPAQGG